MALKETSNGLLKGTFILNRLSTQFYLTLLGAFPTDKLSVIWIAEKVTSFTHSLKMKCVNAA